MQVIIVCHTEFGYVKEKKVIFSRDNGKNVNLGVKNVLKVADKYKAKVCFALMPEVVSAFDKKLRDILKQKHEIALHVHPDDKLIREKSGIFGNSLFLRKYNFHDQKKMIGFGKNLLEKRFNVQVKTFIAGKWSENNETLRALVSLGFTHDCTPNPGFYCWTKLPRICMPYHPSIGDYQKSGSLPILMIPVSKLIDIGLRPKDSVTPEIVPFVGLEFLKAAFKEYYLQDMPVFHIYFHSNAMTSDYYVDVLDNFLSFISKYQNIEFKIPSEIKIQRFNRPQNKYSLYLKNINKCVFTYFLKRKIAQYIGFNFKNKQ